MTASRLAGSLSLLTAAILSASSAALQPDLGSSSADRLHAIAAHHAAATASATLFVVAQLATIGAVLAIARLIRDGAPVLSRIGLGLGVLGAFGHAVYGGASLLVLEMTQTGASRQQMTALLDRFNGSPYMAFAAAGLLGTVVSIVVLAAGLWRSRASARWVPLALWAFVPLEFALSNATPRASLAAGVLYTAAYAALALQNSRPQLERSATADRHPLATGGPSQETA